MTHSGRHEAALNVDHEAAQVFLRLRTRDPDSYSGYADSAIRSFVIDLRNLVRTREAMEHALKELLAADL